MAQTKHYYRGSLKLATNEVDWLNDNCYAILLSEGYEFDAEHEFYEDVSDYELEDADYDPQPVVLKNIFLNENNQIVYDCNNISFGEEVTIGPAYGFVVLEGDNVNPQSDDPLLFFAELDEEESVGNEFIINVPDGLYLLDLEEDEEE